MVATLCTKKRFLIPLFCGTAIALFIVSGLNCVTYQQGPATGHAWPTTEFESKPYIMPECPSVEESLQSILGDQPYELTKEGFDAIRDWVAYNLEYMSDEERVGKTDDWQTPEETLANPRVGDCEDFSILLCSLLRAYGIGAERVYVVIGVDSKEYAHAFLMEDWYLGGKWRRIEPQTPAQFRPVPLSFPFINSGLDRYEIIAAFNDLHYHDESFPWDEGDESFWTLANMTTATEDIARRLSQLLGYLRGLVFN